MRHPEGNVAQAAPSGWVLVLAGGKSSWRGRPESAEWRGEVATVERVGSGLVWRGGCSEKVARLEEAYGEQGAGCQAITIFEEKSRAVVSHDFRSK